MLGKQRAENPRVLAEKIIAQIDAGDLCESPAVAGAGFINFTLRRGAVAEKTMELLRDQRLGVAEVKSPRRIVIDFGSPNVAKPMHVGHSAAVLGDALARIAQFLRHEVSAIIILAIGARSSGWLFTAGKTCSIDKL